MSAFFLDIPHIADPIVFRLSLRDLKNCRLVNHAWHDALIYLQWVDAVLLRKLIPRNFPTVDKWPYADKRQSPEHDQILLKRAQYFHALSMYGTSSLPLLAGCTNLEELCYVVEHGLPSTGNSSAAPSSVINNHKQNSGTLRDQGLDDLAKLVLRNPHLGAISIQNVRIDTNDNVSELLQFIKFLDHFPGITGFYLGINPESLTRQHPQMEKTLLTVLDHRLNLVSSLHVRSLQICRRGCRRADRGLSAPAEGKEAAFWRPMPSLHNEQYMRMEQDQSLSVIENNGHLELVLPRTILSDTGFRLRHYPAVQSLSCREMLEDGGKQFLEDLPRHLTGLQELNMDWEHASEENLSEFVYGGLQPSSVSIRHLDPGLYMLWLRRIFAYAPNPIYSPPSYFLRNSLVRLSILGGNCLELSYVLELLVHGPALKHLDVHRIAVTGEEPRVFLPWACQLRTLNVGLGGTTGELRGMAVMNRVKSLMERVAEQTQLEELTIHFDYQKQLSGRVKFPGSVLCLYEEHGFTQFVNLIRLESFTMLGIDECIERDAVEWMAQQWPRLRFLGLPYSDMAKDDYENSVLEYWPTNLKPHVELMEHWY